jgi:hypothetical protein
MTYLQQLPALVNAIRVLMGKSPVGASASAAERDHPLAAIAELKPSLELRR